MKIQRKSNLYLRSLLTAISAASTHFNLNWIFFISTSQFKCYNFTSQFKCYNFTSQLNATILYHSLNALLLYHSWILQCKITLRIFIFPIQKHPVYRLFLLMIFKSITSKNICIVENSILTLFKFMLSSYFSRTVIK